MNRKRIIAIPTLVLVVSLALLAIGVYSSTQRGPCQASYQGAPSVSAVPVLILESGSSGEICIRYTNALANNISSPVYSGAYSVTGENSFSEVSPSSISIEPRPSSISFIPNNGIQSQVVVYKVTVAANVTSGIYGLFLYQICDLQPLMIGTSQSGLNASDFSWYPHNGSCPAQILQAQIIGLTSIKIVFVAKS